MTSELTVANQAGLPLGAGPRLVPALVVVEGERTVRRYVEFFTANIRNPNTRAAYARAASGFFAWREGLGLALPGIQPVHVAAWIEQLGREGRSAPTVKQNLAAVRMLFDWLVAGPLQNASRVSSPAPARFIWCWTAQAWSCSGRASGMPRSMARRGGSGASCTWPLML